MARSLSLRRPLKSPQIKIGDVWDALPGKAFAAGAGLGTSYFHQPFGFSIPTRKFADSRVADPTLIAQLNAHGIDPVVSGNYGDSPKDKKLGATSWNTMADWSDPGTTDITGVDAVAFYLGGWTPHVWTATQIKDQSAYWALPIWVYNPNTPGSAQGTADGKAALGALKSLGIPTDTRIVVDMEGSTDISYLQSFRSVIAQSGHGYHMTIYGEASTVFTNWTNISGPGGGWWVADWTGTPHIYGHDGVWATQWIDALNPPSWDQDVIVDFSYLWWHQPVTFTFKGTAKDTLNLQSVSKSSSFIVAS